MKPYSVIITHYQREKNLKNTLRGLETQTEPPHEVIIVEMGNGLEIADSFCFKLRIIDLPIVWKDLPVAAARNFGAKNSATENLVFLDVDCIPATDFCERVVALSSAKKALVMGTPRYMLHDGNVNSSPEGLDLGSVSHPARPLIETSRKEDCYEMFWSLCTSIPAETFWLIGGFDENYKGYGIEDTDFALETKRSGVPFYLSGARVYHQQHPVYVPPLNHLKDIVRNSNRYFIKWGYWPMADCLREFTNFGYIDWRSEQQVPIIVLRTPDPSEIAERLVKNAPYR